jgi:hypothetical protein
VTSSEPPGAEEDEPRATSGYDAGFFVRSADDRFELKLGARVQGRFEAESSDPGGGLDRDNATAFSIARARLTLRGHALSPDIRFKLQADFGQGDVELKDFYVDYRATGGVVIRAGQTKRPFSRQQISSSARLEMVDRAITNGGFDAGRDIGVMVHNDYQRSPEIEWAVGVFNGRGDGAAFSGSVDPMTGEVTGDFSNVPGDVQPAVVARVGLNRGGIRGYSEPDLEGGPLRLAIAASLLAGFDGDGGDDGRVQGQVDGILKTGGLSVSAAVYVASAQDGTGFADQAYSAVGAHLQGGYMISERLEPVVRYALVAPDGSDASHEIAAGLGLYRFKHNFKWQSEVALLGPTGGIADGVAARSQLQLSF